MQAEPTTLAGALAQVETLCQWDREGLPQGAEEVIKRLVKVLPARIEGLRAATKTQGEDPKPWPTCERKTGRCQLYSQISDLEDELAHLHRGVETLFNLLEGCSIKDTPVELEVDSAYFFAFAFGDYLKSLKAKWEELRVAAGAEHDTRVGEG